MLIGAAITSQVHLKSSANTVLILKDLPEFVPLVPSVAGVLLIFFGTIRISLATRPLHSVALGFVFVVVGTGLPFAAAQLIPEMKTYFGTLPSLGALYSADRQTHLSLNSAPASGHTNEASDLKR